MDLELCADAVTTHGKAKQALEELWDGAIVFYIPGGEAHVRPKPIDLAFIEEHKKLQAEVDRSYQAMLDCFRATRS